MYAYLPAYLAVRRSGSSLRRLGGGPSEECRGCAMGEGLGQERKCLLKLL